MNKSKIVIWMVIASLVGILGGVFIRGALKGSYSASTYTELSKPSDNGEYYNNLNFPTANQADPSMIKVDDTYYVYSTSSTGIRVYKSTDFKTWTKVTDKALSDTDGFARFWAPEVYAYNGKYYMFYTAVNTAADLGTEGFGERYIYVVNSTNPEGPFINKTRINTSVEYPIDPNVLFDDNGKIYLYTKSENGNGSCCNGPGTSIYVEELNSDLLSVKSGTKNKVLTLANTGWEVTLVEGSHTIKANGKYYLMYSSGSYANHTYTIGYAVSDSPTGGFERRTPPTGSALLRGSNPSNGNYDSSNYIYGTGHNSVLYVSNEEMYIVYHSVTFDNNSFSTRKLNADYMGIDSNGNLYVNGPSNTIQPLPSGSMDLSKISVSDYTVSVDGSNTPALKDNINYKVLYTSSSLGATPLTPCTTKSTNSITINLNANKAIEDVWIFGTSSGFGNATANVILNDKYIINNYNLGNNGTAKVQLPSISENLTTITINFSKDVTLSEVSLYGMNVAGQLTPPTYTATFKNGSTTVATEECTLNTSTFKCTITTPAAVTKSGYTFKGWGSSATCTSGINPSTSVALTSNGIYYACFVENSTARTYTATFKNGDTTVATKTCTTTSGSNECQITMASAVTKSGYKFMGWAIDANCTNGIKDNISYTITSDKVYYACFVANSNDTTPSENTTPRGNTTPSSNNDSNVDNNPKTGGQFVILIGVIAIMMMIAMGFYSKELNKD